MPASLPTFSRGLKLVRIGVFVMLLQLVLVIVATVKAMGADTIDESRSALTWMEYLMLANLAATLAMFVGVVRAIPELARARMDIGGLVIAAAGFVIASAAVGWSYHLLSSFIEVALNPNSSMDDILQSADALGSTKYAIVGKDLAYSIALISVLRTVQRSAAINDQLALRDEAGSMSRALIVMLVADLFYQLTYGLGGSIGVIGVVGSLLVGGYWIFCHLRLFRFLYNAAYFVNEPHDLPIATALRAPEPGDKRRTPPPRATTAPAPSPAPSHPPTVAPPPPTTSPPRAPTAPEGEAAPGEPRFLR